MSLTSGTRIGPYEVTGLLGAGGMGEVYRARDANLDREVAIKVLPQLVAADEDRLKRFEREARVLASLNHPNIAQVFGIEDAAGSRALVMELVQGEDLSARVARGPIPLADALPIARQIAEALEAAHEQGVIHRDLKPANVKVRDDGVVKVLDFGLAKAVDSVTSGSPDPSNSPTLTARGTQMGMILGTAAYMSPEQAKGRPVDRRADIWAFGAVLYEMLTGRRAFGGDDVTETLAAVIKDTPPYDALPSGTPRRLRHLIARCLDRDLKSRLRDIGEARIALAAIEGGAETDSADASPATRRAHPGWIAAGVVAGAAVTAIMMTMINDRSSAPTGPAGRARFQLTLPEAIRQTVGDPSISPDGRTVSFIAGDNGQVWLRPIDGDDAKPLAGTEGARAQFWSPDSAFLAFFANGKLKRIDVNTGVVQNICDSVGTGGGAWNRDGVIIFAPMLESPLFRVPAAGGTPTPLTTLDPANQESNHMWPEFLPDGRHYIFQVFSLTNAGLYIGSLDSTERTLLVRQESLSLTSVRYAPSGHLVYQRNHQLVAHPFDAGSLKLTGEAFPLAEGYAIGGPGWPTFGVSNTGVLVYQPDRQNRMHQLTWFTRDGKPGAPLGPPGPYATFAFSPDWQTLAYGQSSVKETSIWLLDVARGTSTRFTADAYSVDPLWSPSGDAIVFGSVRNTPPNPFLRTLAGVETRLATVPSAVVVTGWAADGQSLIAEIRSLKTNFDLWLLQPTPGKPPVPFLQTPFNEDGARISPDGKWVAFSSDESGTDEIYITTFPTAGRRRRVSTSGGIDAHWRDDGKELFFQEKRNVMAATIQATMTGKGSPEIQIGVPRLLFALPEGRGGWIPGKGAQQFLVAVQTAPPIAAPVTVVLNWDAGSRSR